ncbi:hypothetical protein [uncultured Maricaulis sp.]|uniref:hypothetical protein n=1 Tax=uncultured Maricaulis sp. TaxID=174710 RepID=UPI0030DCCBB6
MKIDLCQNMADISGNVVKSQDFPNGRPLWELTVEALLAEKRDVALSGSQKLQRFTLAQRIAEGSGLFECKPEELTALRDAAEVLPTLAYGQVMQATNDPVSS